MPVATRAQFGAVSLARELAGFRVWAPRARSVAVRVRGEEHELREAGDGVWEAELAAVPGDDYRFVLDGSDAWPDPCSRWQPEGVRGPSRILDTSRLEIAEGVVYNHIGPGSEALPAFAPYFTDRLGDTPWGDGLDYGQAGVREGAIQNAELWVRDYRIDGLRLDAVHAVRDDSPRHVLAELAERVRAVSPAALVISEMGGADFRPLLEWGHDALWLDSLHHALHVALTGERDGYYASFDGSMGCIAAELARPESTRIVACAQNHDQVGNRALGDRLPPEKRRVAAAVVLFSRFTPLLFQGEEYGEEAPFQFFTDHIDPTIAEATREGRRREFAGFAGFEGEVADPQDPAAFERSKLHPRALDPLYKELRRLRRELPDELEVALDEERRTLVLRRGRATLRADFRNLTVELDA